MRHYHKIVILICLLACITASASAWMSWSDCIARGGSYSVVYSNPDQGSNVVTTKSLDNGRLYYITAGQIWYPNEAIRRIQADAQFFSEDGWVTYAKPVDSSGTVHSFLQINENDVIWEAGNTPHLSLPAWHEYTIQFTGKGAPISLRIKDWYDGNEINNGLSNNFCHLPVCIIPQPKGCTPGFWKRWTTLWVDYKPSDLISSVFDNAAPFDTLTLHQGLSLQGGSGVNGAKEILLRAAIAAVLDEAKFGDEYGYDDATPLIDAVNAALASGNRDAMLTLATELDGYNNQYCIK